MSVEIAGTCAVCEGPIAPGTPYVSLSITHETNYWSPVSEPTVLLHSACLDELNLTVTTATTRQGDDG